MSYEYSAIKNRQQKHPKVHYQQYLSNTGEPRDDLSHDSQSGQTDERLERNYFSRRHFRSFAQRLRDR